MSTVTTTTLSGMFKQLYENHTFEHRILATGSVILKEWLEEEEANG